MAAKKDRTEQINAVLALICEGKSTVSACKSVGIARVTFLDNVDADKYARAREANADRQFEEMDDLEQKALDGDIDPATFRAVMDSRKWRLARMRPRVYGDKQTVDVNANVAILTKEQRDAAYRGAMLAQEEDDLK